MLQQGVIGYGDYFNRKGAKNSYKARGNSKKRGAAKANPAKKRGAKGRT
jgi:hypothetical protein